MDEKFDILTDIPMWRMISGIIGIIIIVISNSFWYEICGIGLLLIACLIPKHKKKFTKYYG